MSSGFLDEWPATFYVRIEKGIAGWTNVNECKLRCPNTIGATVVAREARRWQLRGCHWAFLVTREERSNGKAIRPLLAEYSSHPNIWLGNVLFNLEYNLRKGKAMGAGFFEKARADSETWDLGLATRGPIQYIEELSPGSGRPSYQNASLRAPLLVRAQEAKKLARRTFSSLPSGQGRDCIPSDALYIPDGTGSSELVSSSSFFLWIGHSKSKINPRQFKAPRKNKYINPGDFLFLFGTCRSMSLSLAVS